MYHIYYETCNGKTSFFGRVFEQFRIAKSQMGADFMWQVPKTMCRSDLGHS